MSVYTPYILAAITLTLGIIGFFLKRTVKRMDDTAALVCTIKDSYAKKEDLDKHIQSNEQAYAKLEKRIDERFDKIDIEVDTIKKEHLLKEDFYREMAKLDGKMQRIVDLLLQKGKE